MKEQNENSFQKHIPEPDPASTSNESYSNVEKDPDEWITGAEPMTGAQKSYLKTLSDEAPYSISKRRKADGAIGASS